MSIWMKYINIPSLPLKSYGQMLRYSAAHPHRDISPFVLDETIITEEFIAEIADALIKPGKQFMRVAFVGTDRLSHKKLKKLLYGHGFTIKFFDGIEPAKEWLLHP